MATIIDELVITLGLDPTKMTRGQQQAVASLKNLENQARSSGGRIETSAKGAAAQLSTLSSQALRFGSVLLGIGGMTSFVSGLVNTAQHLGFVSKITGTSVENLSAWRNAARLAGGSADGMTSTMSGLNRSINQFLLSAGEDSALIEWFRKLKVNALDGAGKVRDSADIIMDVLRAFERERVDPGRRAAILQMMGVDPDSINAMLQGTRAWEAYLNEAKKFGPITEENARIAKQAKSDISAWVEWFEGVANRSIVWGASLFKSEEERGKLGFGPARAGASDAGTSDRQQAFEAAVHALSAGGGADTPSGLAALVGSLRSGGNRVTSTTGGTHSGRAHGQGLAVDFVPADKDFAGASARLRAKLSAMGIDARVINAETPDSASWTAPHVHAEFANPAAAARFAEMSSGGRGATDNSRSNQLNIQAINVQTNATDAAGIADGIGDAVRNKWGHWVMAADTGQGK